MSESGRVQIQPIQKLKVADAIAAQLEELIRAGRYALGSKLPPERELAEQLGVARSSMREGLRILESNGLLRTVHGVGAFVESGRPNRATIDDLLGTSGSTVRELFEVRETLESKTAALAADRRSDADLAELQALLEEASSSDTDDDRFIELDALFHACVARATTNQLMANLFDRIGPTFMEYSHRVIGLPGRRSRAHAGHQRIYESIRDQDAGAAHEAALKHLHEVEHDIQETMAAVDPEAVDRRTR